MTQEKENLNKWDYKQSIDDLPPEAWDAVRDKRLADKREMESIIGRVIEKVGIEPKYIAQALYNNGFKRD